MDKILIDNLQRFDKTCADHKAVLKKIKDYRFDKNFEIIQQLFDDDKFDKSDLEAYTDSYDFYFALNLIDDQLDEYKYLFDTYNVYYCPYYADYYERDEELTTKWRKIMKKAYPGSWYVEDVKELLNRERQERIELINDDIDEQIKNL